MLFPRRTDSRVISTAFAPSTRYQLQLSREFWLESIFIFFSFTTGTVTYTTPTADAFGALLKSARLSVTDSSGNRKVLDATGPALLEEHRNLVGSLDRTTSQLYGTTTAPGNATTFTVCFPIWFRHPQLADPLGAATMIALPRLSNDPILEIDVGAKADIAATLTNVIDGTATNLRLWAQINRRDVLIPDFPVIASELITYTKQWNSAGGKQDFEIPAMGSVTGLLISDYRGGTTRGTVLGSGGTADEIGQDWSIEYLSTVVRRQPPISMLVENDFTNDLYPTTWSNFPGSYFMDFLTDFPGQDAFSSGSVLDVNPLVLNGGKARLVGSSLVTTASSFSNITIRKLFGNLKGLKFI